jgi:hypothetical protein
VLGGGGEDLCLGGGVWLHHRQAPGSDPTIGSYDLEPWLGAVRMAL